MATFDGARKAIGIRTLDRSTIHTTCSYRTSSATRFDTIASDAIVAHGIVCSEIAGIRSFIAAIGGTRTVVVTNDGTSCLTPNSSRARLDAIAIQAIVTCRIVRRVVTAIVGLVARIGCTRDAVITIDGRSSYASHHHVARFHAVTEQIVRAQRVVFDVFTRVHLQIAEIVRASHTIVAIERRTIHAPEHRIARFQAVARHAIAAKHVAGRVRTRIGGFIASIHRARNAVVAWRSRTWRTTRAHGARRWIARFRPIAIQSIAASCIVGSIRANSHCTNINCTGKPIVAIAVDHTCRHASRTRTRAGARRSRARSRAGRRRHSASATQSAGAGGHCTSHTAR